jgi:hypothetical protein
MLSQKSFSTKDHATAGGSDITLWLAVLERAIRDVRGLINNASPNDPVWRADARSLLKWFYSESMEVGASAWICAVANMSHESLLKAQGSLLEILKGAVRRKYIPEKVIVRAKGGRAKGGNAARDAEIMRRLSAGERPIDLASTYKITAERICQIRFGK